MKTRMRNLNKTSVIILLNTISFLFLLLSCGNRPKEVLSEKEMIDLMADMQIAEAYASSNNSRDNDKRLEMGKAVLAKHGVTQEQLDTTLAWYGRNLDEYSALFEKVDKQILKRRKKYTNQGAETETDESKDNLWPYGRHIMISESSNSNGLVISLPGGSLEKGDRLTLSMHIANSAPMRGVLGVEYLDGTSEAYIASQSNSKTKYEISLQTDTSKTVKRIYGTLTPRESKALPVFLDSIKMLRIPYDSLEYRNKRTQKQYGKVVRKVNKPEKTDKIIESPQDSLNQSKPINPTRLDSAINQIKSSN